MQNLVDMKIGVGNEILVWRLPIKVGLIFYKEVDTPLDTVSTNYQYDCFWQDRFLASQRKPDIETPRK